MPNVLIWTELKASPTIPVRFDPSFIWHKECQFIKARAVYRQALPYFHGDTHRKAWTHYNLGMLDLLECHPDTDRHLSIACEQSHKRGGLPFLPTALMGLAAAYCLQGWWRAAETNYHRAIEIATDDREVHD